VPVTTTDAAFSGLAGHTGTTTGAIESTEKLSSTGVGSLQPDESMARAASVCSPSVSSATVNVVEEPLVHAPPSSAYWNVNDVVELVSTTADTEKVAEVPDTVVSTAALSSVSAVLMGSTVNALVLYDPTLPTASMAATAKECDVPEQLDTANDPVANAMLSSVVNEVTPSSIWYL